MARTVREVMTADPATLPDSASVQEAATLMRDQDVGDVLLERDGEVAGIVTDRDIVVRAVADGRADATLGEVASTGELVTLSPDDGVEDAVRLMRDRAVRRIPVVENGKPVGVVSLGDLAVERDPQSALADISAKEPSG